jgi:transcriptional regulator with XRE-family HTH domain
MLNIIFVNKLLGMRTLKELRTEKGLRQADIAELLKISVPQVSNYESGISLPTLEEMIILERHFGKRINWLDDRTRAERDTVVQSLIELYERYPLEAVSEFAGRMYRRERHPDKMILTYALAVTDDVEPLLPIELNGRCKDCDE